MPFQQDCPLCGTPATYTISHNPYCKHFECSVCKEFWIDQFSEDYLAGLVKVFRTEWRAELSKSAGVKTPGHNFILRESRDDERGGNGHGVAYNQLIAEWVSTSE